MLSMFIILTMLISLNFISLAISRFLKLEEIFLSFPLLVMLVIFYLLALITRDIYLPFLILVLFIFLLMLFGIFYLIYSFKINRARYVIDIKVNLMILIITIILYSFSKYYLPEFVSLMPYSESAQQISLVQNVYFSYDLINVDRQLNILPILIGYIFKCFPLFNETSIVINYCNILIFLYIFFVVELIVKVWRKNNCHRMNPNEGVILFCGLIFTLASLKLSYLTYFWIILPISLFCYYLNYDFKISFYSVSCLLLSMLSMFTFGITFKLALFIAIILSLLVITKVLLSRFDVLTNKYFNYFVFLLLLGSYFIYYLSGYSIRNYINAISLPSAQNLLNPVLDISTMSWLLNAYIVIHLFLKFIKNNDVKLVTNNVIIAELMLICLNPFFYKLFESVTNYSVILFLLFNPIVLSIGFENDFSRCSYNNKIVFASCFVMVVVSNKFLINPYYLGDAYNYDQATRIEKQELEIYEILNELRPNSELKIVSQAPFTKAFIPGSILLDSYDDMVNRCQYCDVDSMQLHEPNKLINIFNIREYSGNRIFIEDPQYDNVIELLVSNNYQCLILRNDQIIETNGQWTTLVDLIESQYELVYQNEVYSLLMINL